MCVECGAEGPEANTPEEADIRWNNRTPEPGTSIIRWTRHDGTEETLPKIYESVLLRDANSFAKIPMKNQGRRGDEWFFEDGTRREIEIGDEWTYYPEPQVETA